jgi:hypothetical protein
VKIPFKKTPDPESDTLDEGDARIDQMVDTMLDLMGDLKHDAERIEETLRKTKQVGQQYSRLLEDPSQAPGGIDGEQRNV